MKFEQPNHCQPTHIHAANHECNRLKADGAYGKVHHLIKSAISTYKFIIRLGKLNE